MAYIIELGLWLVGAQVCNVHGWASDSNQVKSSSFLLI